MKITIIGTTSYQDKMIDHAEKLSSEGGHNVRIRVSQSEKEAFNDAAKIMGISLSSWMRTHLRKAAIRDLEEVGKQAVFLIEERNKDE